MCVHYLTSSSFRSLKLFSRHMKLEKQSEILKSCVSHFAVGTPERLKALLQQGTSSMLILFFEFY